MYNPAPNRGGLILYKWKGIQTEPPEGWRLGDKMIDFPNQGNPRANWKTNYGLLRAEMSMDEPIYDSFRDPVTGAQVPSPSGFLRAERYILETRDWRINVKTGEHMPPRR